jgi:flagellar hook-basal body complex protein FliE
MAIQTVGGIKQILNSYSSEDWAKSAELKIKKPLELDMKPPGLDDIKGVNRQSFSELLSTSLMEVNKLQEDANSAIQNLAAGRTKNIHETLIKVEEAEIAFKAMNQIRSKVITAYQDIMKMQV